MRALAFVESLCVAAFLVAVGYAAWDPRPPPLPPIDAAALAVGDAQEQWAGIFIQDKHVGFAVSRDAPTADGGRVYSQQATFSLQAMGNVQKVLTAGSAVTGADGALRRFEFLLSSPMLVQARGEVNGSQVVLELSQGGETQELILDLDEPPVMSLTLSAQLRGRELASGQTFEVPYFDPLTLSNTRAVLRVEEPELLPNGERAFWVTTTAAGVETRRLIDEHGDTLREESTTGMRMMRMTREEAMAVDEGDPPDMVALAAVPLLGVINEERVTRLLVVKVEGVEASRFAHDPPMQQVEGEALRVSVPLLAELPTLPVVGEGDLEETPSLPVGHPEIVARARDIVGDAPDRLEATRRIHRFVHDYVKKVPTIGVPNGLSVLRDGRGDCNEHTALFVSLARAAGIPSRIAAGLVYSSRTGDRPAFYYHAWPEVRLGGPGDWVPVDPTLDQFPADATHLKIVNGDLERQVEIMGMIGKVKLSVVDAR